MYTTINRKSNIGRFAVAALSVASALACSGAAAQAFAVNSAEPAFAPGRILVMPRAGLPDAALSKILDDNGGGKTRRVGKSELRIVDLPAGKERSMVEKLSRHPHIKFAEVDRLVKVSATTNDPYLGSEWHIQKIGATTAWDSAFGTGVTIAILDTGVDGTHPDLAGSMVQGWNVYDNNSNTADVYGHGTKVAGAAAASANNGMGVAGVAGTAKIMPIRISDTTGAASFSAMASGITWAADHGARVANISYVSADSAAVNSAASYMKSKGGLVTTSAGNYGTDALITPTTAMIPVSATDSNDAMASWSSFGAFVALSAPGVGIYTTTNGGGYGSVSGTSFSSPVTAGVIALMMSAKASLTSADVEILLYKSAVDLGATGRDAYYGYGRVDAAAAVRSAVGAVSTADTVVPTASISAPLGSTSVSGLVAVNASASDNIGVSRVELRVNGALLATDTAPPYSFSWDSKTVVNGMTNLVATAYDAAGNAGNSAPVSVAVSNVATTTTTTPDTSAPTVVISNPKNGARVTGMVSIGVTSTDNNGTSGIRDSLYINGKMVATAIGGTLSYNWNTRKLAAGTYAVQAVATDAAGNTTSQAVTVTK